MSNLLDVAKLKIHLGIADTDSSQDDALNQLADQIWGVVCRYTGRQLDAPAAPVTEYYDGSGTQYVYLRQRPVTSVTSLYMDQNGYYGQAPNGFDPTLSLLTQGTDYYVENFVQDERNPSRIVMITNPWAFGILFIGEPIGAPRNIWPIGQGNIKVTYTAGYTQCPDDLELACFQLIAMVKNSRPIGQFKGQVTMGSAAYTLLNDMSNPAVGGIRSTLAAYKETYVG